MARATTFCPFGPSLHNQDQGRRRQKKYVRQNGGRTRRRRSHVQPNHRRRYNIVVFWKTQRQPTGGAVIQYETLLTQRQHTEKLELRWSLENTARTSLLFRDVHGENGPSAFMRLFHPLCLAPVYSYCLKASAVGATHDEEIQPCRVKSCHAPQSLEAPCPEFCDKTNSAVL